MPRRKVPLVAGETYHLYNRGVNRQRIVFERENYLFFLRRSREYLVGGSQAHQTNASPCIIAYCLMPNHFHLLLQPNSDELSRQMQKLGISYTKAVNKRFSRVGSLFQGQFRAVRVDRDVYLLHLSRYIHLNPLMAGLVKHPQDWEFSSYRDYIGLRQGTLPRPELVLSQFSDSSAYQAFIESYRPEDRQIIEHLLVD